MKKLNLNLLTRESVVNLIDEYQINVCEVILEKGETIEVWCRDGDYENLLIDSDISVGKTYNRKKEFIFDDDYEPVGLDYNDYIETVELIQDGKSYYYPVYCAYNGCGAEDAIAILNPVELKI